MINTKLMKEFLNQASSKLEGEWLLIGGTVITVMGINHRVTTDIDMVNLNFQERTQDTILLMSIAEKLGLPPESINQAGSYFVSKINDFSQNIVPLEKGAQSTIYRPNVYLYLKLKAQRLSETDFEDCIIFVKKNQKEALEYKNKIVSALLAIKTDNKNQMIRIQKLLDFIKGIK